MPSQALGRETALANRAREQRKKRGIKILLQVSIPLTTPFRMTQ